MYIWVCTSSFIMRLACVFVYNAPPEVSHKVASGREHGQLCRDTNSVCMWDRITLLPCDWPALRQTSNKRQAKSIQDNNLWPRTLQCKQSGDLMWVETSKLLGECQMVHDYCFIRDVKTSKLKSKLFHSTMFLLWTCLLLWLDTS